jgi:hypothetical protein
MSVQLSSRLLTAGAVLLAGVSLASGSARAQDSALDLPPTVSVTRMGPISTTVARPMVNRLGAPADSLVKVDRALSGMPGTAISTRQPFGPRAFGSFGIPYTTTRVMLGARDGAAAMAATDANLLSVTYPYRAIGKMTFDMPTGSTYCSASVIRRGVIVTAAHCIQDFGTGSAIFRNFRFLPGHYGAAGASLNQREPYGGWTPYAVVRPVTWANGRDRGCNAARDNDLAVLVMRKDGQGRFLGDVVGKLSYAWNLYSFVSSAKTGNLRVAAVSTLGYPFIQDGGAIMQRTDGPTYPTTVCNAKQLWQGSNFGGGSSGGPWVVNFSGRNPVLGGGAVPGTASRMAVIAVTSWGSNDPNVPKDNYASQFGQNTAYPNASYGIYGAGNIGSLLNTLCSSKPLGSAQTYAQMGYCD